MGSNAVEARNLRKIFRTREGGMLFRGKQREIVAVNDVSFHINFGEIFGLFGPNGARASREKSESNWTTGSILKQRKYLL